MHKRLLMVVAVALGISSQAQQSNLNTDGKGDTLTAKEFLPDITVVGKNTRNDIHQLPEIVGTHIFAGKKNALVVLNNVNGNIVMNNMRQVLAKVPGIHIWESDGSGIQIGIASRGLSPNRSWDFNVRQNGYDISADPFGYPEAYYNPPLAAVQRLQIVKGAGSLQYGPQIGGMFNYVIKNGSEITKPFEFETINTAGSFGLINTFNSIGGATKKSHYYAFFDHRNADGYRQNSHYKTNTGFATYTYKLTEKLKANIEVLRFSMLSQQPGGLTDSMFKADIKQSRRSRNWFNLEWLTTAATLDYKMNDNNIFNLKLFGLSGDRNSVGFMQAINIKDTINATTKQYNNRVVDVDRYRNYGAELRYLTNYNIGKLTQTLTASVRYFHGKTDRLKNGKGTTDVDDNYSIVDATFPQDLNFATDNFSAAIENVFRLTKEFIIIPAARFESVSTTANGRLSYSGTTPNTIHDQTRSRNFVLFGVGTEYHIGNTEVYANFTQSYRPMQFADLAVASTTDSIDGNLKDAHSYNIDLGYRGKLKNHLTFDLGLFYLNYNNRIGNISGVVPGRNFKTNVGNSISQGFEGLIEFNPMQAKWLCSHLGEVSVFASYAYTKARYDEFSAGTTKLNDKKVENAPEHILRSGITYYYKGLSLTGQVSYVGETFSDANNTLTPNTAATTGLIPSYTLTDFAATYRVNNYTFKAGVNNLTNEKYFTRRAGGYPGPGLMPSDARGWYVSLAVKL
jgi:Fe(3+) dicitrate transport protein